MTTYVMGEVPFENVYLHGLIRDKDGEKMSKSKPETAIDPLDAGVKYGFDAVRLSLLIGNSAGNDIRLYDEKIEGFRNFVNKLWNISRFILLDTETVDLKIKIKPQTLADQWILSRFNNVKKEVTRYLDEYNFSQAGEILKEFTWNEFADWYLEIAKVEKGKNDILIHILVDLLKLWHPFVPFVTEAIWSNLGFDKELMISDWPSFDKKQINAKAEQEFEKTRDLITKIRNLRSSNKIEPAKKVNLAFIAKDKKSIEKQEQVIKYLSRVENFEFVDKKPEQSVGAVFEDLEVYLLLAGLVDLGKEKERLQKEAGNLENYINGLTKKLANEEFVKNAPKTVVASEQKKLEEAQEKLDKIKEQLN